LSLKGLILLYFWLLLFEGALRKWVVPSLATPLLVVRDPILILIYVKAFQTRMRIPNHIISIIVLFSISSLGAAILFGHRNLPVALYGIRANFFHVPLIFIMGYHLKEKDLNHIFRLFLYTIPFMTILMLLQYYSPENAWVNRGVGGTGTAGFAGAGGRMRPPGLFSFTNGLIFYYTLATAVIFIAIFKKKLIPKWLLIINVVCILIAIPTSISRTLLLSISIILLFTALMSALANHGIKLFFKIFIPLGLALLIVTKIPIFAEALETFMVRWTNSTTNRGGLEQAILMRFFGTTFGKLFEDYPLFGYGVGSGTNVGLRILQLPPSQLFNTEDEVSRVLGELGYIIGISFLLFRLSLTFALFRMIDKKNIQSYILFSACFMWILIGQWKQPTALGFTIFTTGMLLASINIYRKQNIVQQEHSFLPSAQTQGRSYP
jgi:hypothetical protein